MESESPTTIILIRPYKHPLDDPQVQRLIVEGTMDPANRFFLAILSREIFYQCSICLMAILFIFLGVPFVYTILWTIPIVGGVFYIVVWIGHWYKARYLHPDMKNIPGFYMNRNNKTCFFVAEAYGPVSSSNIAYVNEAEFGKISPNIRSRPTEIVGTLGVVRDKQNAVVAWIKRMSVTRKWRSHGIGSQLLDTAIRFCNERSFVSIELCTTECHGTARKLYLQKGFEVLTIFHKRVTILGIPFGSIPMCVMSYKTRPTSFRGSGIGI